MVKSGKGKLTRPGINSKPRRAIQAVLFDMDGVLIDSVPAHRKAWNVCLRESNLPTLDRKAYLESAGRSNWDILTRHLDRHKEVLSPASRKAIIDRKEHLLRMIIRDKAKTTPGVRDLLKYLKRKHVRCSVASSGEMANIVVVLEALNISSYFTSILSGSLLPATKPDPMIFTLAAASLGVAPGRCMVVEDAPAGIKAAKAAGMMCCALATTFAPHELRGADIVLENLAQVRPDALLDDRLLVF